MNSGDRQVYEGDCKQLQCISMHMYSDTAPSEYAWYINVPLDGFFTNSLRNREWAHPNWPSCIWLANCCNHPSAYKPSQSWLQLPMLLTSLSKCHSTLPLCGSGLLGVCHFRLELKRVLFCSDGHPRGTEMCGFGWHYGSKQDQGASQAKGEKERPNYN